MSAKDSQKTPQLASLIMCRISYVGCRKSGLLFGFKCCFKTSLFWSSRSKTFLSYVRVHKKIRWIGLGLVKKGHYQFKQVDERKLCSFLLNLKNKDVHLILAQILSQKFRLRKSKIHLKFISRPTGPQLVSTHLPPENTSFQSWHEWCKSIAKSC